MSRITPREAARLTRMAVDNAAAIDLPPELPHIAENYLIELQNRRISGIGERSTADILYKLGRYLAWHRRRYPHKWGERP